MTLFDFKQLLLDNGDIVHCCQASLQYNILLRLYFVDSTCSNIEFTLFLQQHGSISQQGLLLQVGDAICYKKFAKRGKAKFKECMVFIFREIVMICEKVKVVNAFSPPQLNYWVSFQVNVCF